MNTETSQDLEPSEETSAPEASDPSPEAEAPEAEAPEVKVLEPETTPEGREGELTLQLQRLSADYANYQKRVQRDRAKWSQDALRSLLSSLLPVIDNLDSAIKAFEGEIKDPAVYKQGVELVREELLRQLGTHQVTRIEADAGAPFDPDQHEAIMVQEAEGIDAQQISFVARAGYTLGETVLRPTQVGVQKPKPKS